MRWLPSACALLPKTSRARSKNRPQDNPAFAVTTQRVDRVDSNRANPVFAAMTQMVGRAGNSPVRLMTASVRPQDVVATSLPEDNPASPRKVVEILPR